MERLERDLTAALTEDDGLFKALADQTRRQILDRLFVRDGQSLGSLCDGMPMTRFGVMKHLRVLEDAGLIVSRRAGRNRLHFLNVGRIRSLANGFFWKYTSLDASTGVAVAAEAS